MNAEADNVLDAGRPPLRSTSTPYTPAIYEPPASPRTGRHPHGDRCIGSGRGATKVDFRRPAARLQQGRSQRSVNRAVRKRKFKQCHLAGPEVPATGRRSGCSRGARLRLSGAVRTDALAATSAAADNARRPEAAAQLFRRPFILDLSVFDTGVIERFAAERAYCCPGEIEMLHDWMDVHRRPGATDVEFGVRIDLLTSSQARMSKFTEQLASSLHEGDLLLTASCHPRRAAAHRPTDADPASAPG
jgi:hypothetical protein